jgi:hypothetical protein
MATWLASLILRAGRPPDSPRGPRSGRRVSRLVTTTATVAQAPERDPPAGIGVPFRPRRASSEEATTPPPSSSSASIAHLQSNSRQAQDPGTRSTTTGPPPFAAAVPRRRVEGGHPRCAAVNFGVAVSRGIAVDLLPPRLTSRRRHPDDDDDDDDVVSAASTATTTAARGSSPLGLGVALSLHHLSPSSLSSSLSHPPPPLPQFDCCVSLCHHHRRHS